MPETAGPVTELASQYVSQVTKDLEENVREQERVTAEIAALQERLAALQHDHGILLNMQQALGIAAPAAGAVVPAPRGKSGGARRTDTKKPAPKKPAAKKSAAGKAGTGKPATGKPAAGKAAAKKAPAEPAQPARPAQSSQPTQPSQPTLVELVRRYLAEQNEPRSAAEVAEALGRTYPERAVQTKVVRTTLENLVARNGAHRSKQGSSVFYTVAAEPAPETAEKAEGADPAE
ncbi:hypothetical protein [Streptomyces achromogenes]|uniref:hypothetical protein n=1 Tax=Streptomyces achromogenes TaxID=67255 RepID=UPI0004C6C372|nr:hypothetical protein [Streptomyces achromogenes]